jgi:O-methyltransferase/methyltransferase family protein
MQWEHNRVREMIDGYRLSQAIFVAADLGIADKLGERPSHFRALAEATETDAPSLLRLLRALTSAGLLEETLEGNFALTRLGRLLQQDAEGSLHAWARLSASLYRPWAQLMGSVRTGERAFDKMHGKSRWQHLSDNAPDSRSFNAAMAEGSARVACFLLGSLDLSRFQTIVDIGGGEGALMEAILNAYPQLRGVLFDLPEVIRDARPGLAERCRVVEGSFFDPVPEGGDAYMLSRVLHDWNDDCAVAILQNIRRAMAQGTFLFVIERILEPESPSLEATLSDLGMMVMNGGRERTRSEFEVLLAAAQFNVIGIAATPTPFHIIEAAAV